MEQVSALYNVDEAFTLLKEYKITTNNESVRRWLRHQGNKGGTPTSRKKGGLYPQKNYLISFIIVCRIVFIYLIIQQMMQMELIIKKIRTEMWWELAKKFIFEG